jgi:hypothetical protein
MTPGVTAPSDLKGRMLLAQLGRNPRGGSEKLRPSVIACDKREAFAQGSESDEAIHLLSWCGNGLLR